MHDKFEVSTFAISSFTAIIMLSQCSMLVRNTVVTATFKVNGKPPILGSCTPNPSTNRLNISRGWLRRWCHPIRQKMVKIGPAGPARQRVEMWRSNAVIFSLFFTFYRIFARLCRPHFCMDRHHFCVSVRWRVSVVIDFLGVSLLGLKFFPSWTPKTSIFRPITLYNGDTVE